MCNVTFKRKPITAKLQWYRDLYKLDLGNEITVGPAADASILLWFLLNSYETVTINRYDRNYCEYSSNPV